VTIAIVALSAFGLAAVLGFVLLVVKLSSARDAERAATVAQVVAQDAQRAAEKLRDEAVEALTQRSAERDAALAQLVATQNALNVMSGKEATHVREQVASGSAADAVRVVSELLASELPGAGPAGVAAADGAGHAGAAAVQPAAVAAPGDVRRGS
jgi:hypothetical protein